MSMRSRYLNHDQIANSEHKNQEFVSQECGQGLWSMSSIGNYDHCSRTGGVPETWLGNDDRNFKAFIMSYKFWSYDLHKMKFLLSDSSM